MRKTLLVPLLALACSLASAQTAPQPRNTVLGDWRTSAGSVLSVVPCETALCIRLIQVESSAPGTEDHNNPNPALRSRSLCNLEIGMGFHPNPDQTAAESGRLYDPVTGKTYSGSLALDGPTTLRLRGYVGVKLFGRTEVWTRNNTPVASCRR